MKIEFNNLTEILDFLKEIGYKVIKQEYYEDCNKNKEELDIEEINKYKKNRQLTISPDDFKELPRNPFLPNNPYYSNTPIITCVKNDPELSKKFIEVNNNE